METVELFQRLGLALAIGLVVGLERGWRERDLEAGTRAAGIRTFALSGLLGGVWGALLPSLGPMPLAAAGIAFAAAFTLFQWRETEARGVFSATSTVAGLLVFALGAFAVLGNPLAAVGAAVATVALLAARTDLHRFLKTLTWPELRSVIVLLAMSFILLPILPNRPIDPWDAINPYELWLMIVLITAVSFAGHVAVRSLGEERGLLLSAATGELISSTTVTLYNARLAAEAPDRIHPLLSTAICLAWMVSFSRQAAIAVTVNPGLLMTLAPPIGAALAVLGVAAIVFYRRAQDGSKDHGRLFENPLDLPFVLRFGALLALVGVAAKLLGNRFGEGGVFALAGITGFVDVDPITLSSARLAGTSISLTQERKRFCLQAPPTW